MSAFEEGIAARKAGKTIADNPYNKIWLGFSDRFEPSAVNKYYWQDGWRHDPTM